MQPARAKSQVQFPSKQLPQSIKFPQPSEELDGLTALELGLIALELVAVELESVAVELELVAVELELVAVELELITLELDEFELL